MHSKQQTFKNISRQQGLTLLELLLVVTILSAVAYTTLAVVDNDNSQVRFEDTQNRLQMIRKAIIGDSSRTINGQPEIRGFVADMGGLPKNIQELTVREYCPDPQYTTNAACAGAGEIWASLTSYAFDGPSGTNTGLWAGWNGPYLPASSESDYPKFRDGWGNDDSSNNFGWLFDDTTQPNELIVQSYGMEGDSTGTADYEVDYPVAASKTLIAQNDYRTLITDSNTLAPNDENGGITMDFGSPAPCWRCTDGTSVTRAACELASATWRSDTTIMTSAACVLAPGQWQPMENVCLKIGYRIDGSVATLVSSGLNGNHSFTWDGNPKSAMFSFEDTTNPYDEDTYLPQGQMVYRLFEYSGGACTANEYPKGAGWRLFSLVPRSVIQSLKWPVN